MFFIIEEIDHVKVVQKGSLIHPIHIVQWTCILEFKKNCMGKLLRYTTSYFLLSEGLIARTFDQRFLTYLKYFEMKLFYQIACKLRKIHPI